MAVQMLGIKTKFTDDQGHPLIGGSVHTYYAGTSLPQDTFSDPELTVPNTNPVKLDDTGSANIFLKGTYRVRVFDREGKFVEEQDNVDQLATAAEVFKNKGGLNAANERIDALTSEVNSVKEKTLVVESIADLSSINNPKDGLRVYVKSYHAGLGKGGGYFIYDSSKSSESDGGTVFNGWVREQSLEQSGVYLTWFGAVPDEVQYDTANAQAVEDALRHGRVIVDGYYYVHPSTTVVYSNSFSLEGRDSGCGFDFTAVSTASWLKFGSIDKVSIDNVTISYYLSNTFVFISRENEEVLLGSFSVTNSRLLGRMRFIWSDFSKTLNPFETPFGIERFVFNNNIIKDTEMFVFLINSSPKYIEIKNNNITNSSRIVFNFSNYGDGDNKLLVKDYSKYALVEGNTLINDDDFYSVGPSYHCLFLYLGDSCVYRNNWVEGIKTIEANPVYDSYISSRVLHYHNNTWKNNLCLNDDKDLNIMLKAKGSYKSTYTDNNYIVEREFLERHNALTPNKSWVSFFDKTDGGSDESIQVIRNNSFNVYNMLLHTNAQDFKSVEIIGNTFNCYNMTGSLLNKRDSADMTTYADAYIKISENTFNLENAGLEMFTGGAAVDGFSLGGSSTITNPEITGLYMYEEVSGNRLYIKNVSAGFYFGQAAAEVFTFTDNHIVVGNFDTQLFRPFHFLGSTKQSVKIKNSSLTTLNNATSDGKIFSPAVSTARNTEISFDFTGISKLEETRFFVRDNKSAYVVLKIHALTGIGEGNYTMKFKMTPTGVEYLDESGEVASHSYPSSGSEVVTMHTSSSSQSDLTLNPLVRPMVYRVDTVAAISTNLSYNKL